MKRKTMMMTIGLALVLCLAGIGWSSGDAEREAVQITGTVLQGGLLVDDEGQEYQLQEGDAVIVLEDQVGKKIEVKGTLMENSKGQKVITIEDYQLVNE